MQKKLLSVMLVVSIALVSLPRMAQASEAEATSVADYYNYNTFSIGSQHIAVIDENGSLWTWGKNFCGQLGNGESGPRTEYDSLVPVKVMDDVISVTCNHNVTGAIKSDHSLWMWGSNIFGALGNGTTEDSNVPIKVMDNVLDISIGEQVESIAAIKTDGSLWTWGYNSAYNLGIGNEGNAVAENNAANIQTIPTKILDNVVSISMGILTPAAIKSDGSLWMWGSKSGGMLSSEGNTPYQTTPMKIMEGVSKVSVSGRNAAVVKTDGSLWVWGANYEGQLGIDTTAYQSEIPVKMMDNVVDVKVGLNDWISAIKADGSLWTWGRNEWGCLGNGTIVDSSIPTKIMENVVSISTNSGSTVAIKTDGSLWTWGLDPDGYTLGNGGVANGVSKGGQWSQTAPMKILNDVVDVKLGVSHTGAALKEDGSIWLWGPSLLGNGNTEGSKSPITIPGFTVKLPKSVIESPSADTVIGDGLRLPTEYIEEISDISSAITAVSVLTDRMTNAQKVSPNCVDLATLYAETAASKVAATSVAGDSILVNATTVSNLGSTAVEASEAVEMALADGGVTTARYLSKAIVFTTNEQDISIQIDPDVLTTEVDKIRVETPTYAVTFKLSDLEPDLTQPLTFTAQDMGTGYAAGSSSRKATVKVSLPSGRTTNSITVSLPSDSGDTTYQAIVSTDGQATASKYNPATTTMDGKINTSGTYTVKSNEKDFTDISGKSAEMQTAIRYLASKGIISGTTATTFSPDGSINRAEIATLLVKALGKLDSTATTSFSDVTRENWFYTAAASSQRHKLINGYEDNTFRGTTNISKIQIVAVASRVLKTEMGYKEPASPAIYLSKYSDTIDSWAQSEVALATKENLVVYRTDGTFSGDKNMTRGDAAIIIYRLFQRIW